MAKKVLHVPQHKSVTDTPDTPDLGFGKIYPKSDGYWYRLDDLGNEEQFADSGTIPDLQAITNVGNTTTYDINLDGSSLVFKTGLFSTELSATPTANNILTLPDVTGVLVYGTGTIDTLPVFSTANGLGDSYLSQDVSSLILDQTKAFDVVAAGTMNIGTANASIINIGWSGATVNIKGSTLYEQVTELLVEDSLFTINKGAGAGSASSAGFEIEEGGLITSYIKTGTSRNSWRIKPPATNEIELLFTSLTADRAYTLPNANGTLALTSDLGSYVPTTRTISTSSPLSGGDDLSANRTISISQSNGSTDGYLSSTDWTTFNGKQDIFVGYDYEIHVSQINGSDTTGNGDLLTPVASITKALTLVGSQRKTIIIHPGTYTESPSITVQYTTLTGPGLIGGNIVIAGTVSTNTGCTISGIKMTNLTITTPTATGNVNILNCEISGTLTKSSNADYTVLRLCDYNAANITGAGLVAIFGGNPNFTTVNNASANVILKSVVTVTPVLTAGTLSIIDSIVTAAVTNAFTSAAGTVTTLSNSQFLTSALNVVAPIVLNGFYSIFNVVFDKPSSTLVSLSATGGPTNTIDYFQYINADKFITQGGTSSQFVKGDGTLGTSVSGTVTSVSALTLGTSGTDLSSTVATSTTTPVITLNVPTASASNRGALSSTDWSTFDGKQNAITLTTTGSSGAATFISNTLNIPNYVTTFPQAYTIYVDSQYGVDSTGRGGLSNPYLTIEYALSDTTNTGTFTCNTATNTTLSNISDAENANLVVGQFITGSGIPYDTIIVAKGNQGGNANTVTLSKATTATATGITATWWTQYRLVAKGVFNVATSLNKSGFIYDLKGATIYYGAISLFRFTANSVIPEYFYLGNTHGTSTSSLLFNHTVSFNSVELDYGYAYSAGTGVQIGNYLVGGNAITISGYRIYGEYLDARFGTVAKITGNSFSFFDGKTYGLLGGLSLSTVELKGSHSTPAGVTVYTGSSLVGSGILTGTISFGGVSSFKGTVSTTNMSISSYCSIDIVRDNWGGTITVTGIKNTLNFNTYEYSGSLTVDAGASLQLHGGFAVIGLTVAGTLTNFATIYPDAYSSMNITVTGTFMNHGHIFPTGGNGMNVYVGANGLLKNFGLIQTGSFSTSGANYRIENNGEIEVAGYGVLLQHTGTFNNNGSVITRGALTNAAGVVTINSASAEFNNKGLVYNKNAGTGSSTISKTLGILRLYPGSVLKVSNGLSPIICTANTSASRDIYLLHCITNCNGSTYGLGFAFDGSSFVPNDLAGGLKYENTAY